MGSIEPFDIERRIRLGIAESLRILEAFGERDRLVGHAGQDVIAGAVHDAVDAGDTRRAEPFAQRLDHRYAAGDGRLETKLHPRILSKTGQCHPMPRQQCLVGGHHRASGFERRPHRSVSRTVLAPDQFDEQVNIGRFGQSHRIIEPGDRGKIDAAVLGAGAGGDGGNAEPAAELAGQLLAILLQDTHERCANIAEPGDANAKRSDGCRFTLVLHGFQYPRAGVAARLASLAKVENEQRVAGDHTTETSCSPAMAGDESLDGLAKAIDVTHRRAPIGRCMNRNWPIRQ